MMGISSSISKSNQLGRGGDWVMRGLGTREAEMQGYIAVPEGSRGIAVFCFFNGKS